MPEFAYGTFVVGKGPFEMQEQSARLPSSEVFAEAGADVFLQSCLLITICDRPGLRTLAYPMS